MHRNDPLQDTDGARPQDWYAEALADVRHLLHPVEANVREALLYPVLKRVLGFNDSEVRMEAADTRAGKRPDYVCIRAGGSTAAVILEAKSVGVNLTERTGNSAYSSTPVGQLRGYLNKHRLAVQGTWGVVSNGVDWIVVKKDDDKIPATAMGHPVQATTLSQVTKVLAPIRASLTGEPERRTDEADWFELLCGNQTPRQFIRELTDNAVRETSGVAWARVGASSTSPDVFAPPPIFLVCLSSSFPDGRLTHDDIADELPSEITECSAIGVAFTDHKSTRHARGFVWNGEIKATALVDVSMPGSRAQRQVEGLAECCTRNDIEAAVKVLETERLHSLFYEQLGEWVSGAGCGINELRHLIRVLFVWLLQVRGVVPEHALWDSSDDLGALQPGALHRHILWLMDDVLAKPNHSRPDGVNDRQTHLLETVPFLNGSLFAPLLPSDQTREFTNEQYAHKNIGLFSILGRYDWTLTDRSGYATESAIDPSLLGDIFERLILDTIKRDQDQGDGSGYGQREGKMPGGTYYTPQDLADEMVTDALAGWTEREIRDDVDLQALFHPVPKRRTWKALRPKQVEDILAALQDVSILDPCCGSGAFVVAVLQALCRAHRRLHAIGGPSADVFPAYRVLERAIERNVCAMDIHPLAVLITRLRVFVALMDVCSDPSKAQPLPNLDTRIVAANTLGTQVGGTFDVAEYSPQAEKLLGDLGAAREAWTTAHTRSEKTDVIEWESGVRRYLRELLLNWGDNSALDWLTHDILYPASPAMNVDPRLGFPKTDGWDVVVGNPPYGRPDAATAKSARNAGYAGIADCFLLFVEAALSLVKRDGCVVLIVPNLLAAGRKLGPKKVRCEIDRFCERVDIRTYDCRPSTVFPDLPWIGEGKQNTTRPSIVRLLVRTTPSEIGVAEIYSRGIIRMRSAERASVLNRRDPAIKQVVVRIGAQGDVWPQAPTKELASLLQVMHGAGRGAEGKPVVIPGMPRYFITALPPGRVTGSRHAFTVPAECEWAWIGLYNSRLFMAYWLMMAVMPDVTAGLFREVARPEGWNNAELLSQTESTARRLDDADLIEKCRTKTNKALTGDLPKNCNFRSHLDGRLIIDRLDSLLLRAYGISSHATLDQLKTICKVQGSAHDLWMRPTD